MRSILKHFRMWKGFNNQVAPSRFELESYDPESQMMDRYTKGLCVSMAKDPSYFKSTIRGKNSESIIRQVRAH